MTKIPPPSIGAALKSLREKRGLTQQELAAKLGKSRTAVAAWEYGRVPSTKSRAALAKALGVTPDELGPAWNPNATRPQYRRRAREEAAYLETLRRLGQIPGGTPLGVDPGDDAGVTSSAPAQLPGGESMSTIPDAEQFEQVIGFWRAMTPDNRRALVAEAWNLARPAAVDAAPAKRAGKARG